MPSQILREALSPKVVLALTPQPRGTSSAKVLSGYTFNFEVISAFLLHFKPILDLPFKKIVKKAPVHGGKCTSKTWSFSSACKNLEAQHPLGAEIWSSEQCDLLEVKMSAYNFVRSKRNSTRLFLFNAQKILLVNAV